MIRPFDLDVVRAETPGCSSVLHLNNAGAALMPTPVLNTHLEHLELEARTGGYEAHAERIEAYESTYDSIASLINCERSELGLIENATRAWDMAFYGTRFKSGDRILTGRTAYASNYIAMLQVAKRTGARIELIDNDEHGQISVEDLRSRIDDDVKLIAITHVPTNGGVVNPASQIGEVSNAAGIPFLLDACQSVGQLPVDVEEIGCDMLSATGRKFLRGPRGTGFLYVRTSHLEKLDPPFLDLHAADLKGPDAYSMLPNARRFENWEGAVGAKIALGVAASYASNWDVRVTWERVQKLASMLRKGLRLIPGISLHDRGLTLGAIITFSSDAMESDRIKRQLRARDINVSISFRKWAVVDDEKRHLPDVVRASVHYYNSESELERFLGELRDVLEKA